MPTPSFPKPRRLGSETSHIAKASRFLPDGRGEAEMLTIQAGEKRRSLPARCRSVNMTHEGHGDAANPCSTQGLHNVSGFSTRAQTFCLDAGVSVWLIKAIILLQRTAIVWISAANVATGREDHELSSTAKYPSS